MNHRILLAARVILCIIDTGRVPLSRRSRPRHACNEIFTRASVSYTPEDSRSFADVDRRRQPDSARQGHSVTTGYQGQSAGKKSRVMTARSSFTLGKIAVNAAR